MYELQKKLIGVEKNAFPCFYIFAFCTDYHITTWRVAGGGVTVAAAAVVVVGDGGPFVSKSSSSSSWISVPIPSSSFKDKSWAKHFIKSDDFYLEFMDFFFKN